MLLLPLLLKLYLLRGVLIILIIVSFVVNYRILLSVILFLFPFNFNFSIMHDHLLIVPDEGLPFVFRYPSGVKDKDLISFLESECSLSFDSYIWMDLSRLSTINFRP